MSLSLRDLVISHVKKVSSQISLREAATLLQQLKQDQIDCHHQTPDRAVFQLEKPSEKAKPFFIAEYLICLLVIDQTEIVGLFTSDDLVLHISAHTQWTTLTLREVMPEPVIVSLKNVEGMREALQLIQHRQLQYLLLTDENGALLGVVREVDLQWAIACNEQTAIYPAEPDLKQSHDVERSPAILNSSADKNFLKQPNIEEHEERWKQAEAALRESEEKFRQLANHVRGVFWMTDATGSKVLYINPAYEQIWGHSLDYLYQNPLAWLEAVIPDDRERIGAIWATLPQETFEMEYQIERPDGTRRWVCDRGHAIYNEAGEIYRLGGLIEDITERKHLELSLRQREQEFRTLAENSPDIIARFDRELRYIYINPAIEEISGLSPALCIGKTWRELGIASELYEVWEAEFRQCFAAGREQVSEFCCETLNGFRYYQTRTIPEFAADGRVASLLRISSDITALKQAEESLRQLNEELEARIEQRTRTLMEYQAALQQSEQRFRSLVANIPGAVYRCLGVPDWQLEFITDAISQITGYPASDFIHSPKRHYADIIHPQDRSRVESTWLQAIAQQERFYLEYRLICADGSITWVAERGQPIWGEADCLVCIDGVLFDISDRKHSEIALQESERRLQTIIDSSPVLIYVKNLQGRYSLVNQLCAQYKGLASNELLGKTDRDITTPELANLLEAQDQEVFLHRKTFKFEEVTFSGDQQQTFLTHKFLLCDCDGEPYAVCGISTDITDRKKIEEQIRASLRQKDLVIQEIHHRIKNNLQIVSSLLTLQCRSVSDSTTLQLFRDCQNRILSIALIHEQLYRAVDSTQIDFAEYIRELAQQVTVSYQGRSQQIKLILELEKISLNLDTALPCGLLINELLSNALKYAFPHQQAGEIRIRFYRQEQNQLALVISDNGIGLPDDFNPQQNRTLGLKLVFDLSYQLKGKIMFQTKNGVCFQLTFSELKPRNGLLENV
jgi:PAS domain S-box-containing protein